MDNEPTSVSCQSKDHNSYFAPSTNPQHLNLTRSAHKVIPHLHVSNIEEAADFYLKTLHFELGGLHLDPSTRMASVFMGEKAVVNVYLFEVHDDNTQTPTIRGEFEDVRDDDVQKKKQGTFSPEPGRSCIMIGLGRMELEEYYQILKSEGKVTITHEIEDRPWEFRQFDVVDQDGNMIQFWAFLDGGEEEEM